MKVYKERICFAHLPATTPQGCPCPRPPALTCEAGPCLHSWQWEEVAVLGGCGGRECQQGQWGLDKLINKWSKQVFDLRCLKLEHGKFQLDIKQNIFSMRVIIQNKLPKEPVGFPVLGGIQDWTAKVPEQTDLNRSVHDVGLSGLQRCLPAQFFPWFYACTCGDHKEIKLLKVVRLCMKKRIMSTGAPLLGCAEPLQVNPWSRWH